MAVVAVQGTVCEGFSYEQIVGLVGSAGRPITLRFTYPYPYPYQ